MIPQEADQTHIEYGFPVTRDQTVISFIVIYFLNIEYLLLLATNSN